MNHLRLAAVCLLVLTVAVKAAAQPDMERPNPALETLRAGAWLERGGFDSFEPKRGADGGIRAVAVGWEMPQLTPPNLTPPTPPIVSAAPTPVVVESRAIAVARTIEPIRAEPMQGSTPCDDLTSKARRLRNAAAGCDTDIANGRPSCTVDVTFESPRIPRSLTPDGARAYAAQFEAYALDADERACAGYGGRGRYDGDPAGEAAVKKYSDYYRKLCSEGDTYACDARQLTLLCFDRSPVNNCVRNCLADNDVPCTAMDAEGKLNCRVNNHWYCYERKCPKYIPAPMEVACFRRFPKWWKLLVPPALIRGQEGY